MRHSTAKHTSNHRVKAKKRRDGPDSFPQSEGTTEIYEALKTDHQEIKDLCRKITESFDSEDRKVTSESKQSLARLLVLLPAHSKAEEATLYKTLRSKAIDLDEDDLRAKVAESFEEHHIADNLLNEAADLKPTDDGWIAKLRVLREALEHHIKEEEGQLFKEAKKLLDNNEARELCDEFLKLKDEIMSAH